MAPIACRVSMSCVHPRCWTRVFCLEPMLDWILNQLLKSNLEPTLQPGWSVRSLARRSASLARWSLGATARCELACAVLSTPAIPTTSLRRQCWSPVLWRFPIRSYYQDRPWERSTPMAAQTKGVKYRFGGMKSGTFGDGCCPGLAAERDATCHVSRQIFPLIGE